MGIFHRIFGICQTKPPGDPQCWSVSGRMVEIELAKAPELSRPGGAIRLEGDSISTRVLVFVDDNGVLHAMENRCAHAGRRLDPVADGAKVQCCSIGKSTFDPQGHLQGGSAKKDVKIFAISTGDGKLTVDLSETSHSPKKKNC